jgi:hypothetical protein
MSPGEAGMNDRKDPKTRPRGSSPRPLTEAGIGDGSEGWEARALAQVRSHVRELSGPVAAQAGWETETITRLEDYFDRGEI